MENKLKETPGIDLNLVNTILLSHIIKISCQYSILASQYDHGFQKPLHGKSCTGERQ